ncbi:MAG TPA: GyrI-like domain-containing protein [Bacteroidia bacterium]|jgi:AraC family transcriptional regulator|nr:GyrI-like domain-containing protein [Bacteroidia bacterium]
MEPRIETMGEKKFVGKRTIMSLANNTTFDLWRRFMPRRKEIQNNIGIELYSIEVYPPNYFINFSFENQFEKWAAVEVKDFNSVPAEMETITSPEGLYAIFIHKGPASEGPKTYQYIFMRWLPNSTYLLDSRPHFAVMGEKYKREEPDSEEELWIPVKLK